MKNQSIPHEIIHPKKNLDVYFELFDDESSFVSTHWHNSMEIIYITSGNLNVKIGDEIIALHDDDIILINSRVVHSTHSPHGNTAILIQIPSGFMRHYMPNAENYYFDFDIQNLDERYQTKLTQVKKVLRDMEFLEIANPEAGNLRFTSLLFELLFQLYHNFRITLGSRQKQESRSSLERLDPVLAYTSANYNRPISIAEISDYAKLQPQYFCRIFKQHMGQTYLEYLNEIRLTYIYKDLIHTNLPLYEILEKHGFQNYKLFRKIFRQRFQCTPGELRQETRNPKNPSTSH
ncbi:MAG: AraC family transcriptional regulator [Lachnospiraceae bacterium]|nr:AraC family transcriptional regulator [Lachnospiraceae bacterium]